MALLQELEALLFSSGRAMDEETLGSLTGTEKRKLRAALKKLKEQYAERDTALQVFNEGAAWKMVVRDPYITLVRRIVADTELPRPVLETLAVIAYNRPAVQSRVVEIRGAHAYEHIKLLQELGFVTKQPEGRSFNLKLSEKFFEYFDVEDGKFDKVFKGVTVPERQEPQEQAPVEEKQKTELQEFKRTDDERREEKEFLENIEGKLGSVKEKNDEREDDASFRLSDEEQARADAADNAETPAPGDESTGQADEQDIKDAAQ